MDNYPHCGLPLGLRLNLDAKKQQILLLATGTTITTLHCGPQTVQLDEPFTAEADTWVLLDFENRRVVPCATLGERPV
jgi:hypothetical protein